LSRFYDLPRRTKLTIQYEGYSGLARKSIRFVVRLTPFGRRLNEPLHEERIIAKRWYKRHWRPVTIVIPAYGDPAQTIKTVRSVRRTTDRKKVRVIVVDDATPSAQHRELLRSKADAEVILGEQNLGFAGNVNRALEPLLREREGDVVLLNNDIVAHRHWLAALQFAGYTTDDVGIVGPKLLYPDTSIQFGGGYRNLGAPGWFDHRFRFKPSDFGPANVTCPTLAVTGACMYIKREVLDDVAALDPDFTMAFEDVDYCLRAWQAGHRSLYEPSAVLTHLESQSRGRVQGERELASQSYFWDKWGDWFDKRPVTTDDGKLRIVYVTQDTGVGGGHRVVFEHLNRLAERGHDVSLYSLAGPPDWFDLRVPVREFTRHRELSQELAKLDAIKVATWWATAQPVWFASLERGIPVFLVQDIETSYYPHSREGRDEVLANYMPEFNYLAGGEWNREQLTEMGFEPGQISPGASLATYQPTGAPRRDYVILTLGRTHWLKNLPLTIDAWKKLPDPRPELWLYGIEPKTRPDDPRARYFEALSDSEVNDLYNQATVFVQTSRHEGFCLPVLEAMSAGTPVVCTDAHGNRDFCFDGVNCLMPEDNPEAVAAAITRVMNDAELRAKLVAGGHETVSQFDWSTRVAPLEQFYRDVAVRYDGSRLKVLGDVRSLLVEHPKADA